MSWCYHCHSTHVISWRSTLVDCNSPAATRACRLWMEETRRLRQCRFSRWEEKAAQKNVHDDDEWGTVGNIVNVSTNDDDYNWWSNFGSMHWITIESAKYSNHTGQTSSSSSPAVVKLAHIHDIIRRNRRRNLRYQCSRRIDDRDWPTADLQRQLTQTYINQKNSNTITTYDTHHGLDDTSDVRFLHLFELSFDCFVFWGADCGEILLWMITIAEMVAATTTAAE